MLTKQFKQTRHRKSLLDSRNIYNLDRYFVFITSVCSAGMQECNKAVLLVKTPPRYWSWYGAGGGGGGGALCDD